MSLVIALLLAQMQASHPCTADVHKFCPGMRPGDGQLKACLESHKSEVTAACSAKMQEMTTEGDHCKDDVQKLCPNTKPGPDRMACMRAHKAEVSPECKKLYEQMQEYKQEGMQKGRGGAMKEARAACQSDMEKFCQGVQPGEGRVIACLQQHQADLSPACSSQMKH
ncbi:MAG TPA: cysteine rich repeat-containing protein [Myxococcales bacterium]|jgi:Golgi apparatus protein 1|nr:cysteine rich repeat-containing protein [Myxococcales bacterium]